MAISTTETLQREELPPAVSRVPAELWILILRPLITDPYTCNSLILTSKFLSHITSTIRLSTLVTSFDIAQPNDATIRAFVVMLESIPVERRRVAHLFIRFYNSDRQRVQKTRSWQLRTDEHRVTWAETFSRLTGFLHQILSLISPTLRTLSIFMGQFTVLPALSTSLPHLKSLTIHTSYPMTPCPPTSPLLPPSPFPKLKRIHLSYRDDTYRRNHELLRIISPHIHTTPSYAPNLTYLCVSGPRSDLPHPTRLAEALGFRYVIGWWPMFGEPFEFPKSLKQLVLRTHPNGIHEHIRDPNAIEQKIVIRDFGKERKRRAIDAGVDVTERGWRGKEGPYSFHEARLEWEDMVWGGEGCWGEANCVDVEEDHGLQPEDLQLLFPPNDWCR
ncbi:hypothetical protein JAAARDRAFT_39261 [Jaapia argillacea MUCL 33604]|uniref:Uncharacterized protein n=1 Tax=Jaapia argillacea MUCL 33604 TaxID=933084 RepID=A0A067PQI3_9AGAM|nr:hypothetical protein JAAARDRAFT_39261 [Jaapia argillacea MUCL 33604]